MLPRAARVPRRKKGEEVFSDDEVDPPVSMDNEIYRRPSNIPVHREQADKELAASLRSMLRGGLPVVRNALLAIGNTATANKLQEIIFLAGETSAAPPYSPGGKGDGMGRAFALEKVGIAMGMATTGTVLLSGDDELKEMCEKLTAVWKEILEEGWKLKQE